MGAARALRRQREHLGIMISDTLNNWRRYFDGEHWQKAFTFLETLQPGSPEQSNIAIAGTDIFAHVMRYPTRGAEAGVLEAHDRYIDTQMSL